MSTAPDPPQPTASGRSLWLAPLLAFGLALLVSVPLLLSVARSIEAKDRAAFEAEVIRTADAIRERIDTTVTLLHGTAGLFAAGDEVRRDEFGAYIRQLRLRERYPGILGIGYTERIAPQDMARRVAELRRDGQPQFRVWPEQPRTEYHTIAYLEPLDERNRAAIGYDMYTDATRRAAMARARDEGREAASGKVLLVQEIDERKQAGFLIYLPVYQGDAVPATPQARRSALRGFVYTPLRVGDLLQGVRGSGIRQVDFTIHDGTEPAAAALMLSTAEDAQRVPAFSSARRFDVAGRPWLLRFDSSPVFESLSQRWLVPWLALGSLASAVLLAWITFVQARARRDAEAAAAQRRVNELALQASEERARERAERLEQLYEQLREGERRKDEFLAVLAHELRNPLAPLRTSLEILRRGPDPARAQRAREIAERQVQHMVRLIDDLLDVSRISRGKIALRPERTSLAALLEAAVETSRPLVDARGHRLALAPVDPEVELRVDPARVAQILTNLLNNAANYTPPGGEIRVRAEVDARFVRIAVRDNGIGIAPERLREIFQLFVQVHGPAGGGGLGIGLSLAQRLAELHGGRIEAHSEGEGRGAEFVLVLPRDIGSHAPAPAAEDVTVAGE